MAAHTETASRRDRPWRSVAGGFIDAFSFLTILPLPHGAAQRDDFNLSAAVPWFPVVGALIGGLAGGLRVAFDPLVGRGPSTAIAILGLVAVTGGLHQDALADLADGLGVRGDAERRLEAMRDPRIGAFGALALILWALLLYTSLEQLDAGRALLTLVAAATAGRVAAPLQRLVAPSSGSGGLGSKLSVNGSTTGAALLLAAVIALATLGPARGAVSLAACVTIALLMGLLARRALDGSTGDTLGAAIAVTEVGVCLLMGGMWRL